MDPNSNADQQSVVDSAAAVSPIATVTRPGDDDDDNTAVNTADTPRPAKRQKVLSACDVCHAKKSKCDGGRPACGPCFQRSERYGTEILCAYSRDGPGPAVVRPRLNTQSLIDRIHSLEREIASSKQGPSAQLGRDKRGSETHSGKRHGLPSSPTSSNAWMSVNRPTLRATEGEKTPADAVGSRAFIDNRGASPSNVASQIYGSSTATNLMRQDKKSFRTTSRRRTSSFQPTSNPVPSREKSLGTPSLLSENFSLPQRDVADALLEAYWLRSHTLYPFIDKDNFMEAYQDLWLPSRQTQEDFQTSDLGLGTPGLSDSRTVVFHCALNAIFALGCQLSDTAISHQERDSSSQTFFLRSKSLLQVDILDEGSIGLVQTLLIIAQFLQSTPSPSQCWTSLGLACRIAQGLGLHAEDRGSRTDAKEVELRRRVWYGCTMMDIEASMTLGRPMMTPCQITIPLPSATEDEALRLNQPLSQFTFYNETIKLYFILGKSLSTLYGLWSSPGASNDNEKGSKSSEAQTPDSDSIISLDDELSNFEDTIPILLHWKTGNDTRASIPRQWQPMIEMQTNVLHAQFLHTQVLLHRPTFLRVCRKIWPQHSADTADNQNGDRITKSHSLRSQLDSQSATSCLSAAIDLINLLSNATTQAASGSWWSTTFYLCTAGTVVLLTEACLKPLGYLRFDIDEIHSAWALCCGTLGRLVEQDHPVEPVLDGLCNIFQKLSTDQRSAQPPNEATEGTSTEAQQDGDSRHDQGVGLSPEHIDHDLRQSNVPEEVFALPMQPVIDFMMQNKSFTPFGTIDGSWWHVPVNGTADGDDV
ncbi:uncharacterized protein L3040_004245 [Drepanopeziza brunnea f. sp. 'multigermtubi']|uniref:uncharacterized protein n=1 Tax=Drepanopeziza brunnea f. sp. 'multigermtubi' TaxID=698441 RepID=UPI00238ADABE|nr:hypothetical protein L3040_004245 [Drepanopeziza brunnea f. sp. 'multigermtubi']